MEFDLNVYRDIAIDEALSGLNTVQLNGVGLDEYGNVVSPMKFLGYVHDIMGDTLKNMEGNHDV